MSYGQAGPGLSRSHGLRCREGWAATHRRVVTQAPGTRPLLPTPELLLAKRTHPLLTPPPSVPGTVPGAAISIILLDERAQAAAASPQPRAGVVHGWRGTGLWHAQRRNAKPPAFSLSSLSTPPAPQTGGDNLISRAERLPSSRPRRSHKLSWFRIASLGTRRGICLVSKAFSVQLRLGSNIQRCRNQCHHGVLFSRASDNVCINKSSLYRALHACDRGKG